MTKILVIEDEQVIRSEMVDWLQYENYEVIEAANGRQGLDAAIREIPDLIVCDIVMPQMNGLAVLQALRSNPDIAHIPFIFLTARANHESIQQGLELGANAYLTKPFTLDEVLGTIQTLIRK
ncbi:MAG: response regulator [Anaerolineae bacterium]|nr:response regulator [Anaerolineae bacterium]